MSELVCTLPYDAPGVVEVGWLRRWLHGQPPWRVIRVVHRQRTLGWIDRDHTIDVLATWPGKPKPVAEAGVPWPWSRDVFHAALGEARTFPDAERDVQAFLAQITGRLRLDQYAERAARGVWYVLLAVAQLGGAEDARLNQALRWWTEQWVGEPRSLEVWRGWLRVKLTAVDPRRARVFLPEDRAVFPLDEYDSFVAVPWETMAREAAAHMAQHRVCLVGGELWLPERVALRWQLCVEARMARQWVLGAWTPEMRRSPGWALLLRSVYAGYQRWVCPAIPPATIGAVPLKQWPPCLQSAWLRPRHMKNQQRVAVWRSLLAMGVGRDALLARVSASMGLYYPTASALEREQQWRGYRNEIRWESEHGTTPPRETPCERRRMLGWVDARTCARCDRCAGLGAAEARSPWQRAQLNVAYEHE